MKRTILTIAALATVAAMATACGGQPSASGPTTAPTTAPTTPAPPCNDASLTKVSFKNSVGGGLDGYVLGTGGTGIVLANQLDTDACTWRPYAKDLAGRGYRVLAFDFNSDQRSGYVDGSTDNGDVVAAAAFLRQNGAQKVLLIGASRGGTAVLVAAPAIQPPVAGVISLSGPKTLGAMDAFAAVGTFTVPVLFIAAALDSGFFEDAQLLYRAAPPAMAKLVTVEGRGHGEDFPLGSAASSARAMMAVDEFLAAHAPAA
jgi:pimeloyl-ACP methyl ester carboxylesterase